MYYESADKRRAMESRKKKQAYKSLLSKQSLEKKMCAERQQREADAALPSLKKLIHHYEASRRRRILKSKPKTARGVSAPAKLIQNQKFSLKEPPSMLRSKSVEPTTETMEQKRCPSPRDHRLLKNKARALFCMATSGS